MKILVLSHTRCGSTTLCKWISKELSLKLDESPYNYKTFNSIFELDNIVRKIVVEEYYPSNNDINKFDKVICLSRENSIETAMSFLVANKSNIWHSEYTIDKEWIDNNINEILNYSNLYDTMKYKLKKYSVFQTTYENVYINKSDINQIINYLNITNPTNLNLLEYDKKYRKDNFIFIKDYFKKII
jgi:hypothetical protein